MSKFLRRQKRLRKRARARGRAATPGMKVLEKLNQRFDELLTPKSSRNAVVETLASQN
jgi:hypothetical protein